MSLSGGASNDKPCCLNSTRTFVDESFYLVGNEIGRYMFAAVTIDSTSEWAAREGLRRALPGRLRRFHWREDSSETRERAVNAFAGVPCEGLIMLQVDVPQRRQERFRQHAMWNLVAELRDRCWHTMLLEARERKQNVRDQETMASIQKSGMAGELFTYSFARPLDEPLLWLPDILLGAYGAQQRYKYSEHWDGLLQKPEILEIPPPD